MSGRCGDLGRPVTAAWEACLLTLLLLLAIVAVFVLLTPH